MTDQKIKEAADKHFMHNDEAEERIGFITGAKWHIAYA